MEDFLENQPQHMTRFTGLNPGLLGKPLETSEPERQVAKVQPLADNSAYPPWPEGHGAATSLRGARDDRRLKWQRSVWLTQAPLALQPVISCSQSFRWFFRQTSGC